MMFYILGTERQLYEKSVFYLILFISIQSGRLNEADSLLDKIIEEEKNELGNRPDHMVLLYQLRAANKDEVGTSIH